MTRVLMVLCVVALGCVSTPPPAKPVSRYVPTLAGPFPPLAQGATRVVVDGRGPSGEVVPLMVYNGNGQDAKLVCAKVPCIVDFRQMSSGVISVQNWTSGNMDEFEHTNPKLVGEAVINVDHQAVVFVLINANVMKTGTSFGVVKGRARWQQFDATADEAARFLSSADGGAPSSSSPAPNGTASGSKQIAYDSSLARAKRWAGWNCWAGANNIETCGLTSSPGECRSRKAEGKACVTTMEAYCFTGLSLSNARQHELLCFRTEAQCNETSSLARKNGWEASSCQVEH